MIMARGETGGTAALLRYLQNEWLKRGMDQTAFLRGADLSTSVFSNLKADATRGPSREVLAKLRRAYNLDINLMIDILDGAVMVDENGRISRR